MGIRNMLRSFEKACLRPLAQRLRRACGGLPVGGHGGRVARLERRVDELESLVRELTGLAYLKLADDDDPADEADRTAA